MDINKFGNGIKEIREAKGFGLRQAALQMDISPTYLSRLENKKINTNPRVDTLKKIANGLRVENKIIFELAGVENISAEQTLQNNLTANQLRVATQIDDNLSAEQLREIMQFIEFKKQEYLRQHNIEQ